jgi:hypothetical protein
MTGWGRHLTTWVHAAQRGRVDVNPLPARRTWLPRGGKVWRISAGGAR